MRSDSGRRLGLLAHQHPDPVVGRQPLQQQLAAAAGVEKDDEVLALEEALETLERFDPELAQLVELRFYAGLELSEIRALNGRSESSLKRDWRRARAFLMAELGHHSSGGTPS